MHLSPLVTHIQGLVAGVSLLTPLLRQHDFAFQFESVGEGSEGLYAVGCFVREERRLVLHFGHRLLSVTWHVAHAHLDHESYMRLLGAENHFSGIASGLEEECAALAYDIENFCSDFLHGDGAEFLRCFAESQSVPERLRAN